MSGVAGTFISHLVELRDRLIRAVVGWLLVFLGLLPFSGEIYTLLAQPLLARLPVGGHMIATSVTAPFFVPMKVAMLAAVVIALPHTLYQLWAFVAPGLYPRERHFAGPVVVSGTLLFLAGMAFAYFLVFPVIFGFFVGIAPAGVAVMTDIGSYFDFVIALFLAFGIAFEVPVVVVLLARLGWVSVDKLKAIRAYVIVGAFIVGAIFTPPDVVSQIMLAIPLWVLYELGVVVARYVVPRQIAPADQDASPP